MHSVIQWIVSEMSFIVAIAAGASLFSAVFSLIQVRKRLQEEERTKQEEDLAVARELAIAAPETEQKPIGRAAFPAVGAQRGGGPLGREKKDSQGAIDAAFGNSAR
jgi:hypothetical protein